MSRSNKVPKKFSLIDDDDDAEEDDLAFSGERGPQPRGGRIYGSLPTPISEMQQVTTSSASSDVARSLAVFMPLTSPPTSLLDDDLPASVSAYDRLTEWRSYGGSRGTAYPFEKSIPSVPNKKSSSRSSESPTASGKIAWNILDQQVLTLPEGHVLARTSIFVGHCVALDVTRRISAVLRDRSISATYNNDKAKAYCFSLEHVEFCICLYRGKRTYSHGIIVEVQRRSGLCHYFQNHATAIMDASVENPVFAPLPSLSELVVPIRSEFPPPSEVAGLKIATDLLSTENNMIDRTLLGLDYFISLTDVALMGKTTAARVSYSLLTEKHAVRSQLISLLLNEEDVRYGKEACNNWEGMNNIYISIRVRAMNVLSNMISSLPVAALQPHRSFFIENFVPALLADLNNASQDTRVAHMAANILAGLLRAFQQTWPDREGTLTALYGAQHVGQIYHNRLATITLECIKALQ